MTFQPPPPGGNPPAPPPPPPGQWGPPPGGPARSGGFDPKSVNPLDWALVGIGVLLFLFSFFAYYTVDVGFASDSTGAWHFGSGSFIGWFAFIAGLAGAVIAALGVFMPAFKLPVANYVAAMGLFALSFVLYILGFFIIGPDAQCGGVTGAQQSACENAFDDAFGFGFSYWASLILVLAGAVLALMRAQQTGTALPGPLAGMPNIGNKGPQGGIGGGPGGARPGPGPGPAPGPGPNPPPPGYGPPQ